MAGLTVTICEFNDGSLALSCGNDGMESDLVFAISATKGDPLLDKQREILEQIVRKVNDTDASEDHRAVREGQCGC